MQREKTHSKGIRCVLSRLIPVVAVDCRAARRISLGETPASTVHECITGEGVVPLLLEAAREDRVALLKWRAEGGVIRIEFEEGIDGGVETGVGGDHSSSDFFGCVDSTSTESCALIEVG
jgi:hypothetical protein